MIKDWGAKPFKSVNAWWDHPQFQSVLGEALTNIVATKSDKSIVMLLKELLGKLKTWNKDIFGDLNNRKNRLGATTWRIERCWAL